MKNKTYRMWYDEEAPQTLKGFEQWSIPLGNGYMGLNVFGGVSTELISVTENSMANPWTNCNKTSPGGEERMLDSYGGLNLMAKTFIDFNHSDVSNYQRELILNDAIARVSYDYNGVSYTREYFSTHPDKVSVMRLTASEPGELTFTLRPIAPYVYDYLNTPGDGMGKTGKTVANGDTLVVKGMMDWYDINYEGLYKVIPQGGTMVASNDEKGENGTITVTGADSAIILLAVGTNYHMVPESFVSGTTGVKMDANEDPHEKVQGYLDAAAAKTYDQLLKAHLADHREYFDRASLDLGGVASATLTTDQLLANYNKGVNDPYLEELTFQYARYLLIASNREGCLPANLQGIWTYGDTAAWSAGYWHNINQQMNYWPAFSTNLIDLFQSYVDLNETFRPTAQKNADSYLTGIKSPTMAQAGTGQNGWALATNVSPYRAGAPGTTGHSGPGTGAFTSLLFWDYYDFTRDETILEEHTYPALEGMANFLSKTLKEYDDGKWLVANSASPENADSYRTVGTAFDQQMVYENHLMTLRAAEVLGEENPLLTLLNEQLDKLDPVNVGYSGQVKEYREENYYGEIGDPKHRHISQLVGLYPGTSINGTTEAWLDAAAVSLSNRGTSKEGWGKAHRALCWARVQDADKSYELIRAMFRDNTANNLFGIYHPGYQIFQLDSNCGYTAAVAEMLVQSHAGYVEFLPALPEQWNTGSLRGFTTRGAFEVDAAWNNGQATKFVIESKAGTDCAVKYQNIASATVTDSKGNSVAFTADGTDLIRFATREGETYTITNISPVVKVAAPTDLKISESDAGIVLNWTASADAVSYNVYRAVGDAPTYEQVATGVTATTYNYAPQDISGEDRVTLRITAVGESGRESSGTLAYSLPVEPPEKAEGVFFGQDLQLQISGGEGELYRVYEDGVAVCETAFHIAVVENASPEKTYTVSSVADGRVSAQKAVTVVADNMVNKTALFKAFEKLDATSGGTPLARIIAQKTAEDALTDWNATQIQVDQAARDLNNAMTRSNILKNRPITASVPPFGGYATYSVEKMVDENSETRYAGVDQNTSFTATVTLDGTYHIEAVFVQEYLNKNTITRGKDVTIEVYDGTKWVTALAGGCLTSTPDVPNTYPATTAFILDKSYTGNQLRVTFTNNEAKLCTVFELQAYGQKVNTDGISLSASAISVFAGQEVPLAAFGDVSGWESSNESVVSVEANGKLKALRSGTATVTVNGKDGSKASCFVTVLLEDDHNHCLCGGTQNHTCQSVRWTPWGDNSSERAALPTDGGYYYLVDHINLSGTQTVAAGKTTTLCLNGYNITCDTDAVYSVAGTLNVCDCTDSGTVTGGGTGNGGTVNITSGGKVNLYGGIFAGSATTAHGGVFYLASGATLEMYGGTVTGGKTSGYGGNIYNDGTLKLYGGNVEKGTAPSSGGNVFNNANMTMYGGQIVDPIKGNNLLLTGANNTTISGGILRGGSAHNIRLWDSGKVTITGGQILTTAYTGIGGGIYADKGGQITITGGSFTGSAGYDIGINMITEVSGATNNAKNGADILFRNAVAGGIYLADANSQFDPTATVGGSAKIVKLTTNGISVHFDNLTEGARVQLTDAVKGDAFGTGASGKHIFSDNGLVPVLKEGKLIWSDLAETGIQLSYDDRKNLAQLLGTEIASVEISNEVVTSTKVGTTTPDTHVLVYRDGTLYAVGTGTATLTVNGTEYAVTVRPAKLSLFLITGHSIGYGSLGDPNQSVAIEPGQAYSSFFCYSMPNAEGGLGWGADKRVGATDNENRKIDAFAAGQAGTTGTGSGLAYQWNQLTGEKVWVMNLAVGGSALNEWVPGVKGHHTETYYHYKYETVLERYGYVQEVTRNEIAAGHYTLGHQVMFYFSGANFSGAGFGNATEADMIEAYDLFWGGLKKDLAKDLDGDGQKETLEAMGIIPAYWPDTRDPNSKFEMDKALNYFMVASESYPDVFLASEQTKHWMTVEGIEETFPEPTYATQKKAVAKPVSVLHKDQGGTSTDSVYCYYDKKHLSQVAYNAVGIQMADSLMARLDQTPDMVVAGQFRTVDDKDLTELAMGVGETRMIVPHNTSVNSGVIFETSKNLRYDACGITALALGQGTVTMKNANGTVLDTVTVNVAMDAHIHCVCGGHAEGMTNHTCQKDQKWIPWGDQETEKTTIPTKPGNYYLVSNVELAGGNSISGKISICLNGHTIRSSSTSRVLYSTGKLSVTDCNEAGKQGEVIATSDTNGSVFYVAPAVNGSVVDIYAGTFKSSLSKLTKSGGILFVGDNNAGTATVNIYGGTIQSANSSYPGAGMYIMRGGLVNLYGGTITGGSTTSSGGNIYAKDCQLNVYGGSITGGTAAKGAGIFVADGAQVTLSGGTVSANAETIRIAKTAAGMAAPSLAIRDSAKVDGTGVDLYVDKTFDTEDSAVSVTFSGLADEIRVAASAPGMFASADEVSATKVVSAEEKYVVDYANGELYLAAGAAEVHKGGQLVESCNTFAKAAEVAAECGGIVKLTRNVTEEATIEGDLWVDLNGFSLSGITVSGTVYGMDSTTNDYTAEKAGSLSLAGGKVAVSVKTTTANAGAVRRYLAVEEEGVYSFHRFYFGITHISMNPETAGIGYRATFAGSEAVKNYLNAEAGFGLIASVNGVPASLEDGVVASFGAENFAEAGQTVTKRVLVQNILREGQSMEELEKNAQTVISAVSFLQTKNGDVILSTAQENTFQAMVEAIDTGFETYADKDLALLRKLYAQYESLMAEWEIPNLKQADQ